MLPKESIFKTVATCINHDYSFHLKVLLSLKMIDQGNTKR